jgi:hypothetical protein
VLIELGEAQVAERNSSIARVSFRRASPTGTDPRIEQRGIACWYERVATADHGANLARTYIVFAAGLLVVGIGSLTLILRELRKAPEGYEDEHGFQIDRKRAVGRVFPGSMTTKARGPRSSPHRPLATRTHALELALREKRGGVLAIG